MTPAEVRQFCNDARDLAADINRFCNTHEDTVNGPPTRMTASERRRVDMALMVLQSALERLAGQRAE